jgi:hypothetical protein
MNESITINGDVYYKSNPPAEASGDIKICVLQRGHVLIGRFERDGSECKLHNASVIRSWGTSRGLGELAENGPLTSTKLDKCNGLVEFDYLTVVFTLSVEESKWLNVL